MSVLLWSALAWAGAPVSLVLPANPRPTTGFELAQSTDVVLTWEGAPLDLVFSTGISEVCEHSPCRLSKVPAGKTRMSLYTQERLDEAHQFDVPDLPEKVAPAEVRVAAQAIPVAQSFRQEPQLLRPAPGEFVELTLNPVRAAQVVLEVLPLEAVDLAQWSNWMPVQVFGGSRGKPMTMFSPAGIPVEGLRVEFGVEPMEYRLRVAEPVEIRWLSGPELAGEAVPVVGSGLPPGESIVLALPVVPDPAFVEFEVHGDDDLVVEWEGDQGLVVSMGLSGQWCDASPCIEGVMGPGVRRLQAGETPLAVRVSTWPKGKVERVIAVGSTETVALKRGKDPRGAHTVIGVRVDRPGTLECRSRGLGPDELAPDLEWMPTDAQPPWGGVGMSQYERVASLVIEAPGVYGLRVGLGEPVSRQVQVECSLE